MQYLVICLQWLTEMHSGTFILEMYRLMHHSALLLTAGIRVFVIFYAIFKALHTGINPGVRAWEAYWLFGQVLSLTAALQFQLSCVWTEWYLPNCMKSLAEMPKIARYLTRHQSLAWFLKMKLFIFSDQHLKKKHFIFNETQKSNQLFLHFEAVLIND